MTVGHFDVYAKTVKFSLALDGRDLQAARPKPPENLFSRGIALGGEMSVDAKTIQIFLPDGEPRGVRIAEITTRIVQAIQVPRARLERIMNRPEMDFVGVYFLFGDSEERIKPLAYVGQTEDLRTRLKNHNTNKEFWKTAVVLISRTASFTSAHLRYLEWHAIGQATAAGRYALDNGNSGSKPFITEPMEADVLDAFDTGSVLLSTLGFPLFEPVAGSTRADEEQVEFYVSGPDAKASGRLVPDGFVVFKGAMARTEIVPSALRVISPKRQAMVASGVLVAEGASLRLTEDTLFDSPSGAAMLVLGRTSNGWADWKTIDGRTLHEVERSEALVEQAADVVAIDS